MKQRFTARRTDIGSAWNCGSPTAPWPVGCRTTTAWVAVQNGLTEMLLSPAVKRRAAIEVKRAAVDADDAAAVSMVGRYRQQLKLV